MKITGATPYGIYSSKLAKASGTKTAGALVSGVSPRASSAIVGLAEGALAVALWRPIGFTNRHPIWGTLLGAGAAFNLIDALIP